MKKLIFVRHAKAEEDIPGLSDFERSLTQTGKKVARKMAVAVSKKESDPGLFISSPAFRAIETAMIFAGENKVSYDKIILSNELYYGTNTEKILKVLNAEGNDANTVMIFGHNPAFTDVPDTLSTNGCGPVPKTGVVCLTFNTDTWSGIAKRSGKLEYFLKPEKNK